MFFSKSSQNLRPPLNFSIRPKIFAKAPYYDALSEIRRVFKKPRTSRLKIGAIQWFGRFRRRKAARNVENRRDFEKKWLFRKVRKSAVSMRCRKQNRFFDTFDLEKRVFATVLTLFWRYLWDPGLWRPQGAYVSAIFERLETPFDAVWIQYSREELA